MAQLPVILEKSFIVKYLHFIESPKKLSVETKCTLVDYAAVVEFLLG